MLGPGTADEFGTFGDYQPPASRSQIDNFTVRDSTSVLDGDVTPDESRELARRVAAGERPKLPHGGHRHGTGWGNSEFDPGVDEEDVLDSVRGTIDSPTSVTRDEAMPGFFVRGVYAGTRVVAVVRPVARSAWKIVAALCTPSEPSEYPDVRGCA